MKADKQISLEVFGRYIHTYKFDEAVYDKVVLDLRYEARDIEQKITSLEKIDEWFELKTRGLTGFSKTGLKQKWGTLKKGFSSKYILCDNRIPLLYFYHHMLRCRNRVTLI